MQIKLWRGKKELKGGKVKDTGPKRQRHRKGVSCFQVLPGTGHFQHNNNNKKYGKLGVVGHAYIPSTQ